MGGFAPTLHQSMLPGAYNEFRVLCVRVMCTSTPTYVRVQGGRTMSERLSEGCAGAMNKVQDGMHNGHVESRTPNSENLMRGGVGEGGRRVPGNSAVGHRHDSPETPRLEPAGRLLDAGAGHHIPSPLESSGSGLPEADYTFVFGALGDHVSTQHATDRAGLGPQLTPNTNAQPAPRPCTNLECTSGLSGTTQ